MEFHRRWKRPAASRVRADPSVWGRKTGVWPGYRHLRLLKGEAVPADCEARRSDDLSRGAGTRRSGNLQTARLSVHGDPKAFHHQRDRTEVSDPAGADCGRGHWSRPCGARRQGQIPPKEWNEAKSCAEAACQHRQQTFDSVAQKLRSEIASVRPGFEFGTSLENGVAPAPGDCEAVSLRGQPSGIPPLDQPEAPNGARRQTTLSFHCLGSQFRGVIAASAFLETRDNGPVAVTEDIFRINYKEEATQAAQRFRSAEPAIVKGLTLWREHL